MKVLHFQAASDIIGRRIRVSWELEPEGDETLSAAPPLLLRRKERDFDFPPPVPGEDPYLVYDSTTFPEGPPAVATDLPGWETREADGRRTLWSVISVARPLSGRMVETSRRTVATTFGPDGAALRQRVEVLDVGGVPGALMPRRTYYYQLFGAPLSEGETLRATATATEGYGLNKVLYDSLPEVYRRHDVVTRLPGPGSDTVPEASARGGQLRRFLDLFGLPLDSLRGSAEGLQDLRDLDTVDARFLPLLAKWVGWDLSFDVGIPLQRNELKAAPRVYRSVGTVPGLRALVSHYTGWFTQVAEFSQHILRATHAPQRNLFATTEAGGAWRGIDDAAAVLGFPVGNDSTNGVGKEPARLVGTVGPFALRPGMELGLAVDGGPPAGVRFGAADFRDLRAATAEEVAAVLSATLSEVTARADAGGRLELASNTVGPESSLRIVAPATSLVTLESSPGGRPSVRLDAVQRLHLFYETREESRRELHHKALVEGAWRDAHPVAFAAPAPRASPAAAVLPDGRLWLAFVEHPDTPGSRPRAVLGTPRPATPARLLGQQRPPFTLFPNTRLRLGGNFGTEDFTVRETDYADVKRATAPEVAAAMNAQLNAVNALSQPDGTLRLETVATGDAAWLEVQLSASTTARALGFGPRNAFGRGHWDEVLEWGAPLEVGTPPDGFHSDVYSLADTGGAVSVFWASHRQGQWRLVSSRWDERVWFATTSGVSVRRGSGPFTPLGVAQGLPSAHVRGVAVDAQGVAWFATSAGMCLRRPDGSTAVFNTTGGLPSNDVRGVATAPDGAAWFATAAGAATFREDGSRAAFTTADGLPSNDVRAVAVAEDGTVWLATALGAALRPPGGAWQSLGGNLQQPVLDVRAVAVAPNGAVWTGTAAGLVVREVGGASRVFTVTDGLPSNDVRAVTVGADGAVWFGTPQGLGVRRPWGAFETFTQATGLVSNDVRAVAVGPDGTVWAATGAGVAVRRPDGTFTSHTAAGGLASNDVRAVHGPWSSRRELASGGGGNREPAAVRDSAGNVWLVYSQRQGVGTAEDTWLLRYRRFDAASSSWGPERELTRVTAPARAQDREPGVVLLPGGGLRAYFRSDRGGGTRMWSVSVDGNDTVSAPVLLSEGAEADTAPVPLTRADGTTWLFHRSDRSVPLSQVGSAPLVPGAPGAASTRMTAPGTAPFVKATSGTGSTRTASSGSAPITDEGSVGIVPRPAGAEPARTASSGSAPITDESSVARTALSGASRIAGEKLAPLPPAAPGAESARLGLSRSTRIPDEGSLRRYAGSTSLVPSDLPRVRRQRRWGDLLAYTPQKPLDEAPLTDEELYTRGTLGLYVSRTSHGDPLTVEEGERVRQILQRFLPINARAVLVLAPSLTVESVYPPGADIQEQYADKHPFIDTYPGLADETAVALPGWTILRSTTAADVSANPSVPATWRRRTFFFPPK